MMHNDVNRVFLVIIEVVLLWSQVGAFLMVVNSVF